MKRVEERDEWYSTHPSPPIDVSVHGRRVCCKRYLQEEEEEESHGVANELRKA